MSDDYSLRVNDPVKDKVLAAARERLRTHAEATVVQTLAGTYLIGDTARVVHNGIDMGVFELKAVHGDVVEWERIGE